VPITFTRCATVQPGQAITSSQMASMADAFNSRLRSGLGDGTYRIPIYLFFAARQIRNSDGGFLFPPQGEYFEQFQCAEASEVQWPNSFAGTPEGVNVSNPLGAFVFGNETAKAKSFTVPRGCCNCGCPTKAYSTEACEVLAEMEAANDMLTYRELKQVLSDMLRAHFEERTVQAGG